MPAMPLAMEVGVLLERLAVALDDPANRSTLYAELLNPDLHIWQSSLLTPEDADHMEHHWMQWMHNWTGDIEGITRETMRRTLEVAGELGHDEPLQGRFPAHHPIDLFVTCGAEQFQGFVSWRTTSTAGRHVVALFSAPDYSPPPPDDYEYWTGITPDGRAPVEPNGRADVQLAQGVLVVGHIAGTRVELPPVPAKLFESSGPVMTARLAAEYGGMHDVPPSS